MANHEKTPCEEHASKIAALEAEMKRIATAMFGDAELKLKGLVQRAEDNFFRIRRIELVGIISCAGILGMTCKAFLPGILKSIIKWL